MADEQVVQAGQAANNPTTPAITEPVVAGSNTEPASVVSVTPQADPTAPAKAGQVSGQVGQDWSVKYSTLEKNYNELRKKLVEQGTERNEYKKQLDSLSTQQRQILDAIAKASEKEYDPDQFMEELRAQGPKFFQNLLQKEVNAVKESLLGEVAQRDSQIKALELNNIIQQCRNDATSFPDFQKLEDEMRDAFLAGGLPFDPEKMSNEELVKSLYNFVRLQHSQDALKAAEQIGRKKTEAELAREAQTGVASGGKTNSPSIPDLANMSLADVEKYVKATHGMADR